MNLTDPFRTRPASIAGLPRIVRVYILNCLMGFALAGVFTGLILGFNVANVGHLVASVDGGWLAALVFFMLNGIVFAGVQSAIAIMSLAGNDTPPAGGTRIGVRPVLLPAPAPAKPDRRDR